MRRFALPALLLLILLPATAGAASWRSYASRSLGVSLKIPSNWSVNTPPGLETSPSVVLSYAGRPPYAITIAMTGIKPARSLASTVKLVMAHDPSLRGIHWSKASIGGKPALAGVSVPQTEGGVGLANGIYVTSTKGHVYSITILAFHRPPPTRLSQFPAIYRQILGTLRFAR
jgi:hypothetical protein